MQEIGDDGFRQFCSEWAENAVSALDDPKAPKHLFFGDVLSAEDEISMFVDQLCDGALGEVNPYGDWIFDNLDALFKDWVLEHETDSVFLEVSPKNLHQSAHRQAAGNDPKTQVAEKHTEHVHKASGGQR